MTTDTREALAALVEIEEWFEQREAMARESGNQAEQIDMAGFAGRVAGIRAALATQPAQPSAEALMSQTADLLAHSMMLADADRVRSGALVVEAHNLLAGTHAVAQPSAQGEPYAWVQHFPGFPSRLFFIKDDGDPNGRAWAPAVTWEYLYKHPAAQPSAQGEAVHQADERGDMAMREWHRECDDADTILRALGLDPVNCRTDGGSLKTGMILDALQARDRMLQRSAPAAPAQAVPSHALAVRAIEELMQLGYTVKDDLLYPPAVTWKKEQITKELLDGGTDGNPMMEFLQAERGIKAAP